MRRKEGRELIGTIGEVGAKRRLVSIQERWGPTVQEYIHLPNPDVCYVTKKSRYDL